MILLGASGIVGAGVLREALADPDIDAVLSAGPEAARRNVVACVPADCIFRNRLPNRIHPS